MSRQNIPKAIRWQTLSVVAVVALVAILIGAAVAGPLRSGLSRAGELVGFGHDHEEDAVAVTDGSGEVQYHTCGMHPWVILPEPGDCPICHMALTPLDPEKFTGEIAIDPVIVQNMGVRVAPVVTGPLTRTIRTVGSIDYNEQTVRDVSLKTPGWIEELHVDYVGAKVEAGEPLLKLYSPQLYAAQEEYLLSQQNQSPPGPGAGGGTDLLESARTRLEYFDITEDQIAEIERTGEPAKTMTIRSPHTGVVIGKHANEGMKVEPGMQVYRIADLSRVWVRVTLYEYQLPYAEEGMEATMTLPYIPGKEFKGKVIYIDPYLDSKSREVQVRLEFDNPGGLLKPGMFASIELENTLAAEKVLAPRSAVIDTGERQMAFVSRGEGKFEPREVRLGVETGEGMVEIISGLEPGEQVVTSGQFLIDSESRIREALAKMIKGDLASEQEASAEVAGASELDSLPEPAAEAEGLSRAAQQRLDAIVTHYLAVQQLLTENQWQDAGEHLATIRRDAEQLAGNETGKLAALAEQVASSATTETADIAEFREGLSQLSQAVLALAKVYPPRGSVAEGGLYHAWCPMVKKDWLQAGETVRNPYDPAMLGCGSIEAQVSTKAAGSGGPGETE
ncbi:MAG: efflux RND transporter periplasmic adaptor subunit [Phycisphaeraceae bacterium]